MATPFLHVKEKTMAKFVCPECGKKLLRDRRFKCNKKKYVTSYCSVADKPVVLRRLKGRKLLREDGRRIA